MMKMGGRRALDHHRRKWCRRCGKYLTMRMVTLAHNILIFTNGKYKIFKNYNLCRDGNARTIQRSKAIY